mmetsp:Transcript_52824/g.125064  ORF Transcript_52824/g.125064 Transcript_52824/m.125064 type:complete len:318 (-) Transcript_52824:112-1065(-)
MAGATAHTGACPRRGAPWSRPRAAGAGAGAGVGVLAAGRRGSAARPRRPRRGDRGACPANLRPATLPATARPGTWWRARRATNEASRGPARPGTAPRTCSTRRPRAAVHSRRPPWRPQTRSRASWRPPTRSPPRRRGGSERIRWDRARGLARRGASARILSPPPTRSTSRRGAPTGSRRAPPCARWHGGARPWRLGRLLATCPSACRPWSHACRAPSWRAPSSLLCAGAPRPWSRSGVRACEPPRRCVPSPAAVTWAARRVPRQRRACSSRVPTSGGSTRRAPPWGSRRSTWRVAASCRPPRVSGRGCPSARAAACI